MMTNKVTFIAEATQTGMPAMWNVEDGRNAHREDICDALASNRSEIDALLYKHGGAR
jgi:hypothetical protein